MSYSIVSSNAEKNARLLFDLVKIHEAKDLGAISGFFEVDEHWCCPVCHRQKQELARIDKNGNLLCQLVWHHDHIINISDRLPYYRTELDWQDARPLDSLRSNFHRFPDVLICGDCNVVEGNAKKIVNAPRDFSFTPFEISTFIIVNSNLPHQIDSKKVTDVFEKIFPTLNIYSGVIKALPDYHASPETFEKVGGAAWRVLREANLKRKARKDD